MQPLNVSIIMAIFSIFALTVASIIDLVNQQDNGIATRLIFIAINIFVIIIYLPKKKGTNHNDTISK